MNVVDSISSFRTFTPTMTSEDATDSLRLDPGDFPKRVELELSEEVVEKITRLAEKTGRSFSEVATDILSKAHPLLWASRTH
jgi:hypothetical protein